MTEQRSACLQDVEIRNFRQDDMALLGGLYEAVTAREHAVFWWVGDPDNWDNVMCAYLEGKMIAKGQVSIINVVPPGRTGNAYHSIYVNIKAVPEWEADYELMEQIYQRLYTRALILKATLPDEYDTRLCVGNAAAEQANNSFFTERKGFSYLESLFSMTCDLTKPIAAYTLPEGLEMSFWDMDTAGDEEHYLILDTEVWPDAPLGHERLAEYKRKEYWNAVAVTEGKVIAGSLLMWREEGHGMIENVFVRAPWRQRGIARAMLLFGLEGLRAQGMDTTELMVHTHNQHALKQYEAVGFRTVHEEVRYYTQLE